MLKRAAFLSLVVVIVLGGGLFTSAARPTQAQDTSGDNMGMITCDSTLVTLLFIAENDYGFHSMYDVSTLDKGEYQPLFDAMMAQMDQGNMGSGDNTGQSDMSSGDNMGSGDQSMGGSDMSGDNMSGDMMMLSPGVVPGENQFCTDLRAELESFFYDHFTNAMMTGDSMTG
jgi:hypothetical protein